MTALWVALLGVLLPRPIAAVDPLSAWIGTPDRRLGFLTWLTFPALFLAGHACTTTAATRVVPPRGRARRHRARRVERGRAPRSPAARAAVRRRRAGGPFGQPAYLGAACLLIGPLALAVACDRTEQRGWRRAGALGAAGALLALLGSQTRAAWVGAVVALLVLGDRAAGTDLTGSRRTSAAILAARARRARRRARRSPRRSAPAPRPTFDLAHGTSARPPRRVAHRVTRDRRSPGARRRARGIPRRVPAGGRRVVHRSLRRRRVPRSCAQRNPRRHASRAALLAGLLYAALLAARVAARVARSAFRATRSRSRSARPCLRTSCSNSSCSRSPSSIRSSGCSPACSSRAPHRTCARRDRARPLARRPDRDRDRARARVRRCARCRPTAQLKRAADNTEPSRGAPRSRRRNTPATRLDPHVVRRRARRATRRRAHRRGRRARPRAARPRPVAARPGAPRPLRRAARRTGRPLAAARRHRARPPRALPARGRRAARSAPPKGPGHARNLLASDGKP